MKCRNVTALAVELAATITVGYFGVKTLNDISRCRSVDGRYLVGYTIGVGTLRNDPKGIYFE